MDLQKRKVVLSLQVLSLQGWQRPSSGEAGLAAGLRVMAAATFGRFSSRLAHLPVLGHCTQGPESSSQTNKSKQSIGLLLMKLWDFRCLLEEVNLKDGANLRLSFQADWLCTGP